MVDSDAPEEEAPSRTLDRSSFILSCGAGSCHESTVGRRVDCPTPQARVKERRELLEDSNMTIDEVRERVEEIKAIRGDDEAAHGREDELWEDVLSFISGTAGLPAVLAVEALKTRDIAFARWCA